jgi:hypothetical protein
MFAANAEERVHTLAASAYCTETAAWSNGKLAIDGGMTRKMVYV